MPSVEQWIECKGLPVATCNGYRVRHGHSPIGVGLVGTELKLIFDELQKQFPVTIPSECTCPAIRAEMDGLGPDGCISNRDRLLNAVISNVMITQWPSDNLRGMVIDSIPTLFDEAVKRAIDASTISNARTSPKTRGNRRARSRNSAKTGCCGGGSAKPSEKQVMQWEYGVTTVPIRRNSLLPRTLASLKAAGFDRPRLFVDGCDELQNWKRDFGLEVTCHYPKVRTAANWCLALGELYLRNPNADRFAVFQDDLVACRNLREYLEKCVYPEKGYLNLFSFMDNEEIVRGRKGWMLSGQLGRGAVALVFNRESVGKLFGQPYLFDRAQDKKRGHRTIDGGIVSALKTVGWKEYIHAPSLVQHTGKESSMGNHRHPLAKTFPGENFDALEFLK